METQERRPEAPIKDYLVTFKFYDGKRRRLSIFGRIVESKLQITILTLSNTPEVKVEEQHAVQKDGLKRTKRSKVVYTEVYIYDTFSRKAGRKRYEEECINGNKCPGRVVLVDILEDRPRYTFLKWCNEHYYRPMTQVVTVRKTSFVRGTKFVHPPKKKSTEHTNTEQTT